MLQEEHIAVSLPVKRIMPLEDKLVILEEGKESVEGVPSHWNSSISVGEGELKDLKRVVGFEPGEKCFSMCYVPTD